MSGTGPLGAAGQEYQEARSAIAQYRLPDARRHIDEARRLLTAADGIADAADAMELGLRIQLTESWLVCDAEGLGPALDQVGEARSRAQAAGRDDLRALAYIQAGVLRARAGFVEDALSELRPAVALSEALPTDDRVRLLLNKGTMGSEAGHLEEAAEDLAAAATLAAELPDYAFMALHNLGFVEYLRGDMPAALRSMHAADDMAAGVDRSVSRLDRARVLLEVGLLDEAAELLAGTVAGMRGAGMEEELTGALLDQARCALLRGRGDEAVAIAQEVITRAERRGEHLRALAAAGVRLEALATGEPQDATALLAEARALAAAADDAGLGSLADRATALRVLVEAGLGRTSDGPGTRDSLTRMRESPYFATRILGARAQLLLAGDAPTRSRLVGEVIEELRAARSGMASLDLRTALTVHAQPITALDLERAAASGEALEALEATERWRAALAAVPSVTPSADREVARLWSELRKRHEELRNPDAPDGGRLQAEVGRLESELRQRSWRNHGSSRARQAERWPRESEQDSALLSYFWASGSLHLVHVPPGAAAQLRRLGERAEVSELVARCCADASALAHAPRGPLGAAVQSSLEDALARLDSALLPEDLGEGPVVVVPSGALARLPWGMLPRLRRRGLTLARSATHWRQGATVVAGAPTVGLASGPDLALAEAEVERVGANWARAVRVAGEPSAVRDALTSHEVVHVAAHGRHRSDNPLFSSLLLHGGSLFAHELEAADVRSSLVVLSACGAGRARLRPGDEALGLTASLLALGVRAVVAPLTDVPDDLACETMAALHAGLAAGLDGPAALAAASQGLLARSFTWFGSSWRTIP